ncbi:sensor domain-containing diguanylate cyclase [Prosthecomicrobium sp. N25]|uniref:sensor domain-containing diguanylate cyclase n=1 Tax=Prosthecomicrobium sp. N25 TaxID=3129254 RepID=UPI0030786246
MYCETFLDDLDTRDMSAEARLCYMLWTSLADGDRLPRLADLWARRATGGPDYWVILRPLSDEEFYYDYFGEAVAAAFGIDMTGQTTRTLEPDVRGVLNKLYDLVVRKRRPALAVHRASYAVEVHHWERLVLPVLAEDGSLRLAIMARPREMLKDLLNAVMLASPVGIVTFQAIRNTTGEIVDASVSTMNPKAETFTGRRAADVVNKSLLGIYPTLVAKGVWKRYLRVMVARTTDDFDYFDTASYRWFNVKAAPLGDGFLLVFSDTTAVHDALIQLEVEKRSAETARAELAAEIQARRILESELRRISMVDELTGALNRRGLDLAAREAGRRAASNDEPLCVVAMDLDHFKHVNDSHGHAGGDAVLRAVAETMSAEIRRDDQIGRVGGEEFMILLPGCGLEAGWETAERLREAVARTPVQHDGLTIVVSASFGVQELSRAGSVEAMLVQADAALYAAKANGRNRVEAYGAIVVPSDELEWLSDPGTGRDLAYVD